MTTTTHTQYCDEQECFCADMAGVNYSTAQLVELAKQHQAAVAS